LMTVWTNNFFRFFLFSTFTRIIIFIVHNDQKMISLKRFLLKSDYQFNYEYIVPLSFAEFSIWSGSHDICKFSKFYLLDIRTSVEFPFTLQHYSQLADF
jgi:hypothetical protein